MAKKLLYTPSAPIVETRAGKLHGFKLDNVYSFRGIKYADAERFQMPRLAAPWDGVRDATSYGYICPVLAEPAPSGEIYTPHCFWPANENCQYLNVWTTSLDTAAKKPVMVWFHGGGFANGSSIEQVAYEGDALAEFGDVVVVTVNHRLNILGYLDMSSFGEKYKNSVNVGIADLVEALRWVRDNIAGFGGDPENVTVFGQSGGAQKVRTLMQTPEAAGLFHKAILMSGIMEPGNGETDADHRAVILGMLRELNIPENEAERLEKVPYHRLAEAFQRASRPFLKEGRFINWGPVPNEWYLGDPLEVGFTGFAKNIPTMAGTVISELGAVLAIPDVESFPKERKLELLRGMYGERTQELVDLFKAAYPEKDITGLLTVDVSMRYPTIRFIEEKACVSDAPAYLYNFTLNFSLNGGRPAWHCADIPFVFHNTHRAAYTNMEGVTEKLEREVAGAFVNFAKGGDPNGVGIPYWPAYSDRARSTMTFDRESRSRENYDRKLMEALHPLIPSPFTIISRMMSGVDDGGQNGEWIY